MLRGPGWILRRERDRRGWTVDEVEAVLRDVGRRLGVRVDDIDGDTVRRWEAGRRALNFRHVRLLADALDVPLTDLLGLTDAGQRHDWLVLARGRVHVGHESEDAMLRREFLRHIAALAGANLLDPEMLAAALSDYTLDWHLLQDLEALTGRYAGVMWTAPPREQVAALRGHLVMLCRLVPGASDAGARRLQVAAAQTALIAGRLEWQLERRAEAEVHWSLAERLSLQAGDSALVAHVLGARTEVCSAVAPGSAGDVCTALAMLDRALELAPRNSSPHLRAWLLARRAEEHAAAGHARQCERDLALADRALSRARGWGEGYFSSWDASGIRLSGYAGNCALRLGRSRTAIEVLERALAGTPAGLVSQRAAVLADLGAACVTGAAPEIDRACALLSAALDLAAGAGMAEKVSRVTSVRERHLGAHAAEPAVRRLDEQIAAAAA